MNRRETRKLWERVADGDTDPEVLEWLKLVAGRVVAADGLPDVVRPGEMLRAVGLSGRADTTGPLREQLALLDSFSFLDEDGEPRAPERSERMRNLMKAARASGLLDDPAIQKLRERIELNKRRLLANPADLELRNSIERDEEKLRKSPADHVLRKRIERMLENVPRTCWDMPDSS